MMNDARGNWWTTATRWWLWSEGAVFLAGLLAGIGISIYRVAVASPGSEVYGVGPFLGAAAINAAGASLCIAGAIGLGRGRTGWRWWALVLLGLHLLAAIALAVAGPVMAGRYDAGLGTLGVVALSIGPAAAALAVGIFFGINIITRVRQVLPAGARAGSAVAAGIVLTVVFRGLFGLQALPPLFAARGEARSTRSLDNLRQIAMAVLSNADEPMPVSLAALAEREYLPETVITPPSARDAGRYVYLPEYVRELAIRQMIASRDGNRDPLSVTLAWDYVRREMPVPAGMDRNAVERLREQVSPKIRVDYLHFMARTPLAWEDCTRAGGKVNVVFGDGHYARIDPGQLQRALDGAETGREIARLAARCMLPPGRVEDILGRE